MIISRHVYAASTNRKREHILPTGGRPNERNKERNEQNGGRVCADSMALKLDGRTPWPRAERKLDNGSRAPLTHVAGHFSASPPPPPTPPPRD